MTSRNQRSSDISPFAIEPEPTVIALPCRVQWAAVTTCELTDKTGEEREVPCVPLAYHIYVRQPPALHTSTMTFRVTHPSTEVTCAALNLRPSVHYAIGVRAVGLAADVGVPVKPSDLTTDIHLFVMAQDDRVPPSALRLSVTTKR